jgi:alkyl sulfatase BDS1-like metallo-beta-lactamase superfamily hydrolase
MDCAVAENVIAGNAMNRGAQFQTGGLLPRNDRGQVDSGLGKVVVGGITTLIAPTTPIKNVDESHTVDGVQIDFHLVPDTEAPSEMVMYFPQFKMIDAAEIATQSLHQLYTLRGAEVLRSRMLDRRRVDSGFVTMTGWAGHRERAVLSGPSARSRHAGALHYSTCANPPSSAEHLQGS